VNLRTSRQPAAAEASERRKSRNALAQVHKPTNRLQAGFNERSAKRGASGAHGRQCGRRTGRRLRECPALFVPWLRIRFRGVGLAEKAGEREIVSVDSHAPGYGRGGDPFRGVSVVCGAGGNAAEPPPQARTSRSGHVVVGDAEVIGPKKLVGGGFRLMTISERACISRLSSRAVATRRCNAGWRYQSGGRISLANWRHSSAIVRLRQARSFEPCNQKRFLRQG
jgi:hypothetical protein